MFYSKIARQLIYIEPLPQGALPIYDKDPFQIFLKPNIVRPKYEADIGFINEKI